MLNNSRYESRTPPPVGGEQHCWTWPFGGPLLLPSLLNVRCQSRGAHSSVAVLTEHACLWLSLRERDLAESEPLQQEVAATVQGADLRCAAQRSQRQLYSVVVSCVWHNSIMLRCTHTMCFLCSAVAADGGGVHGQLEAERLSSDSQ
jgi:hypothetical protein